MKFNHIRSGSISQHSSSLLNKYQVTLFDQQDGKLIKGVVIERNLFWFTVKSSDGSRRKFDISMLPLD